MTGSDQHDPMDCITEIDQEVSPTEEQKEALKLDRNIAVTAGAGTGKTTTLTHRYLMMLEDQPDIGPKNIVTVTFGKDAANEMRSRIRSEVSKRLNEAPSSEIYDYERWREIKDELEDGYIHTLHGFCARLLREYVVRAPVKPEFDTLDEAHATVLMEEVVRELVEERRDTNEDIQLLSRLWNRHTLEAVLVGLLENRPDSSEWAERWYDSTTEEYLDYIWATFHPIDQSTAQHVLTEQSVQDALNAICELHDEGLDIDPEDKGIQLMDAVAAIARETGVNSGDAVGRDWQRALDVICDALTTGSGDRYSRPHWYRGSKGNWSGYVDEQDRLDATATALLEGLQPEEKDFLGGLDAEWNSSHYVIALARLYRAAVADYETTKSDQNALDYHDLIQTSIDFLAANESVRDEVRSQFDYVMVDEMQDTDPLQWKLVKLITAGKVDDFDARNVFLVGDEKQSIYRFRGADVTTFGTARRELEVANPPGIDASKELRGNFRTVNETREFVNALFNRIFAPFGDDHRPYEAQPQPLTDERRDGREVTGHIDYLLVPDDDVPELHDEGFLEETPHFSGAGEREAYALASRLTNLLDDPPLIYDDDEDARCVRPAEPKDIAILLRARTRLKRYERALDEYEIPYTVVSGTGFWDTPEITNLVNLLQVIENPEDDIALYGVLRSPLFGFTDERLARIHSFDEPLWSELQSADGDLGEAFDLLRSWRRVTASGEAVSPDSSTPWGTLLSRIIEETGYIASAGADERPRQAAVNINKFREQLRAWEEAGVKTVADLLTRIERRRAVEIHADEATIPEDADGVQIRTIHSAKGLEFPIVAVPEIGTEFNFRGNVDDYGKVYLDRLNVDPTGTREPVLGIKAPSADDPYEHRDTLARAALRDRVRMQERAEHKRELYVATTRARDHLLLSGVHPIEINETGEMSLRSVKDASEARHWLDWLQPTLLEDAEGETNELLRELSRTGGYISTLDDNPYSIRIPEPPNTDWDESKESTHEYPGIEIPAPDLPPVQVTMTATNFAKAVSPDSAGVYTDELDEDAASVETEGLPANHLGTIVHELVERRPPREHWRVVSKNLAATLGEQITDEDLDRIDRNVERCIRYREELIEEVAPDTIHEELPVATRLEVGKLVGDIDLLLITPDEYHIIDYKTNDTDRLPVDHLTEKYWPQLEVYAAACFQNDGSRSVHTTLYFSKADESRTKTHDALSLDILCDDLDTKLQDLLGLGPSPSVPSWNVL